MRKKKVIFIAVLLSAIIVVCAIKYHSRSVTAGPDAVWVEASSVKESSMPLELHVIGTLVARSVEITPEAAGHVQNILFKDGAAVNKGDTLIQLDDAVNKTQYASAKAKYTYFESDFKRLSVLAKKSFVSQREIDKAESDLKQTQADLQRIEVEMNKMKLTAPFSGVVGKSKVNLGDYVTIGQSVVTLTDTKHLRVEYNVPEKYLPLLKRGQSVTISSSAYPNHVFVGKLSFISPTINTDNRSVSLYADMINENDLLAAGMFVNVTQILGNEQHVLMIPARSLVPILNGMQVYKVMDGKAYGVPVVIGKRTKDDVQILQGLKPGDMVITDGQLKVKDGMAVKVS